MTPLQKQILSAARDAHEHGGLAYTVGGYIDPKAGYATFHPLNSCTGLVLKGHLKLTGSGRARRVTITRRGRTALRKTP